MKISNFVGLLLICIGTSSCSLLDPFRLERDGERCLRIHENKEDREKCFSDVELEVRAREYEARVVGHLDCIRRSLPKHFHLCGDVPKWEGGVNRPPTTAEGESEKKE